MWVVCFLLFSFATGYALQGYYARKSGNGVKTSENYLWYVYIFVYFLTSIVFDSLFSVLHDKCYCLLILGGVYLVVTATLVVSECHQKTIRPWSVCQFWLCCTLHGSFLSIFPPIDVLPPPATSSLDFTDFKMRRAEVGEYIDMLSFVFLQTVKDISG